MQAIVSRAARAPVSLSRRRLMAGAVSAVVAPGVLAGEAPVAAPLFEGMGSYRAADASRSAPARRLFEQGMVLTWGFNPAEAARSFAGALNHDPGCAASLWGLAWSLGPNINADMQASDRGRVDAALRQARALQAGAAPRWRELIAALEMRHPRSGSDLVDEPAYANRMRALALRHRGDADIAVLAAEAIMNLHPYDWWRGDGQAQAWTPEITGHLQRALTLAPEHPGANHDWVHLMERSTTPQQALEQAERLTTLVPGCGHLLHMPAHIYMRVGRYADASIANERSISADDRYLAQVQAQGAYRVGYVAHNHHFLWASASMQGRSARALAAARMAYPAACGTQAPVRGSGTLQHYQALPLYALVRFGRWQEILTGTPPPDGIEPYPLAIWHYARGTALARGGRAVQARSALTALDAAAADPAMAAARIKSVNPAAALARIARLTLQGEIAALEDGPGAALSLLAQAVEIEDALEHDEPHLWLAPTRHALGAALLAARQPAEAQRVFLQDLQHYPENGWSLSGLARAQRQQGRMEAAHATEARLHQAWRDADLPQPLPRL